MQSESPLVQSMLLPVRGDAQNGLTPGRRTWNPIANTENHLRMQRFARKRGYAIPQVLDSNRVVKERGIQTGMGCCQKQTAQSLACR